MWRRVTMLIAIVVLGAGAGGVAHGDTTTTDASTTTASSTTALSRADPPFAPAVKGTSVQLEAPPTMPPTTAAPTTVNLGAITDVPANSGNGQRVIYAKRAQRVWLINADNTVLR